MLLSVSEKELKNQFEGLKLLVVRREAKTLQLHSAGGNVLGLHLTLHGERKPFKRGDEIKHSIILLFKGADGFALTDF